MLRLLADENFNSDIVRGLLLREPKLDIVRLQDVGLLGADDPDVLVWAATHNRIVLTHDRATMPHFAYERIVAGVPMSGLWVLDVRFPTGRAIEEILLMAACTEQAEWIDRVTYLPV